MYMNEDSSENDVHQVDEHNDHYFLVNKSKFNRIMNVYKKKWSAWRKRWGR